MSEKFSARHLLILEALALNASDLGFRFMSFAGIAELSGVDRIHVRRDVRHLARKGLAKFARGLWNEDGEPRGSGYAITHAGLAALAKSRETK